MAGNGKWSRIEDVFPIENGDFPASYVSLLEGNSSHLKMDAWNTSFLLGMAYLHGQTVSFREGKRFKERKL